MKFITGEDLELWYRDKSSTSRSGGDEALQEAFTRFVQGDFDELSRRISEKDLQEMQATELVIKNKVRDPIPVRCIKGSF